MSTPETKVAPPNAVTPNVITPNVITIDGQQIEFKPGDTIMNAAEKGGIDTEIPRFCYHPGLTVAGTCRMCTVEIEKAPKLMTSCSTPCAPGMVVHTQSERVRKSRAGVMEFLLANHPLDCPVCDQAGECYLQDYNYEYGPGSSRFKEEKRAWAGSTTKVLSDKVTLNMNRCIHCERCVRFTEEVTKTTELLMVNRSWEKELTTADEKGLVNDYQGCLTDICPVGALTFNDFRFQKRAWFLKSFPSVCDRCAKGCNIEVDQENELIWRYRPRFNKEVNGHWMCDEGRVSYNDFRDPKRIVAPMLHGGNGGPNALAATNWETAIVATSDMLHTAKNIIVLIGTDSTTEEASHLMQVLPKLTGGKMTFRSLNMTSEEGLSVNGGPEFKNCTPMMSSKDDKPIDALLRRKDRTPNTRGLEALDLQHYNAAHDKGFDLGVIFRSGRAGIPVAPIAVQEIAWGMWCEFELGQGRFHAALPGQVTAEKRGSFTNCDGVVQKFEAVIKSGPGSSVVTSVATSYAPTVGAVVGPTAHVLSVTAITNMWMQQQHHLDVQADQSNPHRSEKTDGKSRTEGRTL